MFKRESVNYKELRKKVSKLFFAVLTHKIPVRDALARFPKDCEDPTLIAAWHALCHLESDEEMRLKDKMYAEEQDNYIEYIAFTLEKGEPLPKNIVSSYVPYHSEALIPNSKSFKGIINKLKRFLCC